MRTLPPNPPHFSIELCLGTMNHAWIQILPLIEKMTAKHLQMSLFPLVLDILPLLELHVPVCWHPPPEWMLQRIEGRDILNCETGGYRCTVHMPKKWHKSIITQLQLQYSANWSANEHQITGFKFKAVSKGFKRIQILDSSPFRSCDFGHAMTPTSSPLGIFLCTRIWPRFASAYPGIARLNALPSRARTSGLFNKVFTT